MCEICWETANTSPSHFLWETTFSPKFWKGGRGVSEKELKSSFHRYLPKGLTVFLVKKGSKIKYGFDDSILYADLGLFQLPNNQLMFSFVTV